MLTQSEKSCNHIMRRSFFAFLTILLIITVSVPAFGNDDEERRAELFNLDDGIALEGYDPVSYFNNEEPREGSADLSAFHKGLTYYFSSEENRDTFQEDPESYEPLYGGHCAYTMLDGDTQDVNPEIYKIVDGRLLLFYRMRFGIVNALNRWNNEAEETEGGDQALIQQANEHWNRIMSE